jgi:hypothetical protein
MLPFVGAALGERALRNDYPRKRLFFPFIGISMKGMVLGQTGDKDLKLLAFFRTIMTCPF